MALALHDALRARLHAPSRPRKPPPTLLPEPPPTPPTPPTPIGRPATPPPEEEIVYRKPARQPLAPVSFIEWCKDARRPIRGEPSTVDFKSCCGEAPPVVVSDAPDGPATPSLPDLSDIEVTLPTPNVHVPLSTEEKYFKEWYEESTQECTEQFVWVEAPRIDVSTVEFTEERLKEIGIPTTEVNRLYWIQDKPEEFAGTFGHWDPVNARWRILTEHKVVPIEQRIAPMGVGYGSTEEGEKCCEGDSFTSEAYQANVCVYESTALQAGLQHISTQLSTLPNGTAIPVASGWGGCGSGERWYYTPHLRHVSIDASVVEEDGKRYVYTPGHDPVKPMLVEAGWSSANGCWVISGAISSASAGRDERTADRDLAAP